MSANTDKEKDKKKKQSQIEHEFYLFLQAMLKQTIDKALDDVLKGFK